MCAVGFENDAMIQEGFREAIESKTFRLRVVPQTKTKTETVVKDGIVYLQVGSSELNNLFDAKEFAVCSEPVCRSPFFDPY